MATYAQLKNQIDLLNKQAEAIQQTDRNVTLSKIRETVTALELTIDEVFRSAVTAVKKMFSKSAASKRTRAGQRVRDDHSDLLAQARGKQREMGTAQSRQVELTRQALHVESGLKTALRGQAVVQPAHPIRLVYQAAAAISANRGPS